MKNSKLIFVIIAGIALVGLAVSGFYVYNLSDSAPTRNQHADHGSDNGGADQFAELEAQYAAMEGEDYDRAFVTEMIAHHQGAVSMANLALKNAKHQELKDMAQAITDTQMQEIRQMENWKVEWGYGSSNTDSGGMAGMDHGDGEMEQMMTEMTRKLNALEGDQFDAAFLEVMIEHHQSALAMARPGVTNAGREEIRKLSSDIVIAQTQEISQMKKWQKAWGYDSRAGGK